MKILIVDDEPLIHRSIEFSLKEMAGDDIEIVHAYNGGEMHSRMEAQAFDAAMVDIRMPGMDGLSAIKAAKEKWPLTDYYIMSGFSEFEYARQALQLGVSDYLLKPVAPEEIKKIIDKIKNRSFKEKTSVKEAYSTWLLGCLHRHDVDYLYINGYFTGIALKTSDFGDGAVSVPEFEESEGSTVILSCDEGTLFLCYSKDLHKVREFLNSFNANDLKKGETVFVSDLYRESAPARAAVLKILELSPLRVYLGLEKRYDIVSFPGYGIEQLAGSKIWVRLRNAKVSRIYSEYSSAQTRLSRLIKSMSLEEKVRAAEYLSMLFSIPVSPDTLMDSIEGQGERLLSGGRNRDRLDSVMEYIEGHYCEELSIGDLASRFGLTPNYLSSLLKTRKNIRFTDHITDLRLKKAKELLLSTDLSVKEISEQIGYHSQSHFTKLFTEKNGYTPMEFRRQFSFSSSKE